MLYTLVFFGAFGGFVRHLNKNNGIIQLPDYNKISNKQNITLGFLYDTILGSGSALCVILFANNLPMIFEKIAAFGFIAGFVGQVILETVSEKFINGLKIKKANDAIKKNSEISKKLIGIIDGINNILETKQQENQKNLNQKLNEVKSLLKAQQERCNDL